MGKTKRNARLQVEAEEPNHMLGRVFYSKNSPLSQNLVHIHKKITVVAALAKWFPVALHPTAVEEANETGAYSL